jgi:HK97 family phage portal protein
MGILSSVLTGRAPSAYYVQQGMPPTNPALAAILSGGDTSAGVSINEWSALNYSAIWAAVNLLSSSMAMMTPTLMRRTGPHSKVHACDHPVYDLLRQPFPDCTRFTWTESRMGHVLLWGNCYARIRRDGAGRPLPGGLVPIGPNRVRPDADERGVFYRVADGTGNEKIVDGADMIHVPGLGFDGVCGYSVVGYARESMGLTAGVEKQGAAFFGNNAQPSGLLISKTALKKEKRDELRESYERTHKGPQNRGRLGLLWGDLEYKQTGMSQEDSQFLETRQFQVEEIARWFNVPPHLLRHLLRSTNNNIEQQALEYIIYSLGPWIFKWKEEKERKLLTVEERRELFIDYDYEALYKADIKSLTESRQVRRQNGVLNADEWRSMDGLNPTEDGSGRCYLVNSAMVRVGPDGPIAPSKGVAGAETSPPATTAEDLSVKLLDLPDIRQTHNYDCGAACTRAVCEFFGAASDDESEENFIAQLNTTPADGTQFPDIIDLCQRRGLAVTTGKMDVDDLRRFFKKGWPVICPVEMYGPGLDHYVVVIGVGLGQVFYHDPARVEGRERDSGRALMSEDDFLSVWFDREGEVPAEDQAYRQHGIAIGRLDEAEDLPAGGDDDDGGENPPASGNDPKQDSAPAKNGGGESGPGPSFESGQGYAVLRSLYLDVCGRVCRREAEAARRASKDASKWTAWAEEFARDRRHFPSALAPLADQHFELLEAELAGLGGRATPKDLAEVAKTWADRWETEETCALVDLAVRGVWKFMSGQKGDNDGT